MILLEEDLIEILKKVFLQIVPNYFIRYLIYLEHLK